MQREMGRIFEDEFSEFRTVPEFKDFFDQPRFGSSFDLQDDGDKHVIRAYLPDRDTNKVKVTVEGQTLRLEARAESSDQKEDEGVIVSSKTQFSQLLTLPGPVQADKMTIERKENMLVVTLPKSR
jgi:HSP20 family molecular chaperone IbpA